MGYTANATTNGAGQQLLGGIDVANLRPVDVYGSREHAHWKKPVLASGFKQLAQLSDDPQLSVVATHIVTFFGASWSDVVREAEVEARENKNGTKIYKRELWYKGTRFVAFNGKVYRHKLPKE